ncbi:urea ABC transporter ATP-binding protein UrtD [Nisaea sediminum]|uniref:urea ABC transporter ATP-binding protein UrtD n=1 Tax=Nisaea sediminum TaxID=2775867 RepID=UPI001865EF1C|nr:urea ABC transporter ATP-binding protein UrtD [Nisaea sediminum]
MTVTGKASYAESQLYVDGVTVSFDGFKALNNLSFTVDPGEMRAIIGPNGAGKTTMMDVITGKTKPDEGRVIFKGDIDLGKRDEAAVVALGIGRKFQRPSVFENHTVFDNLELAIKSDRRPFACLFDRLDGERRDKIDATLERIGLTEQRSRLAGQLSHGQKQWLEIGMLLVQDPELLFLDEPVAGMTDQETEGTVELLRDLQGERSIVVVEHDMAFVHALGVKVTVLHEGSVLAEGAMDQVQNDPRVIEVYLGR